MPSSTSSSEARLPAGDWGKTWLLALAGACLVLGLWEGFWRARGLVPAPDEGGSSWAARRGSIKREDANEVVLIGTSRTLRGFDLDAFADSFGGRKPVQLAIPGQQPIPILDHLSRDESFRGIVVCEVYARIFFRPSPSSEHFARAYIKSYEESFTTVGVSASLSALIQDHLVFRSPAVALNFTNVTAWIARKKLPTPRTEAEPESRLTAPEQMPAFSEGIAPKNVPHYLAAVEEMVERIQKRGGRVVFVVLPTTEAVRAALEPGYPRAKYWDVLARSTQALTFDSQEHAELQGLACADGIHLDPEGARVFTRFFARALRRMLEDKPARRGGQEGRS